MQPETRVCPFCGEPPGEGAFCAACGRNLSDIERLPTRAQWEGEKAHAELAQDDLAARCAEATQAFLKAMHEAGDPGVKDHHLSAKFTLRPKKLRGWVVRPVDREDFEGPKRYTPGVVLSVDGTYHQLDSELHGWGQRDFPKYWHTVTKAAIELPVEGRLIGELDAVLKANGVGA